MPTHWTIHPSAHYLDTGYPCNDLGDGPPKGSSKHKKKTPKKKRTTTPSSPPSGLDRPSPPPRRSIQSYFRLQPAPPPTPSPSLSATELRDVPPRVPPGTPLTVPGPGPPSPATPFPPPPTPPKHLRVQKLTELTAWRRPLPPETQATPPSSKETSRSSVPAHAPNLLQPRAVPTTVPTKKQSSLNRFFFSPQYRNTAQQREVDATLDRFSSAAQPTTPRPPAADLPYSAATTLETSSATASGVGNPLPRKRRKKKTLNLPRPTPQASIAEWYQYVEPQEDLPTRTSTNHTRKSDTSPPQSLSHRHAVQSPASNTSHCNPSPLTIAHRNGHLIFTNAAVSIALLIDDIPYLTQQFRSNEHQLYTAPETFLATLPTSPVAVGLRVIDSHFRNTPRTGYCTTHVLHELITRTPSGSILTDDGRQKLVTSLEYLKRTTSEAHLDQAHSALSRYLVQLHDTETDTLDHAHWMPTDLLAGICTTIDNPTTIWTEDLHSPDSPFSSGWMQPVALQHGNRHVHSRVQTPLNHAAEIYTATAQHVGTARSHHFFIRYPHNEIGVQFTQLILAMAKHLLQTPIMDPHPASVPPLLHTLQVTAGPLTASIPNNLLPWLVEETALTPLPSSRDTTQGPFLYQHVEHLLAMQPSISLALRPAPTPTLPTASSSSILAGLATFQAPDAPNPAYIALLLSSHVYPGQETNCLAALNASLRADSPIGKQGTPTACIAHRWANLFSPTCLWTETTLLPLSWQGLTAIPGREPRDSALWTLTALRDLPPTASHLGGDTGTFSPVALDNPQMQGLLTALTHLACEQILTLRHQRQLLPPRPPTTQPPVQEPTPSRLRFLDNGDLLGQDTDYNDSADPTSTKQTPVDFISPTPKPLIHPAFQRYFPPADPPPTVRTRPPRAPRNAHAQQPVVLSEHHLLQDRELYTLRSYGTTPDDILIGDATAPGSFHGAFCRRRVHEGHILGQYTSRRRPNGNAIRHPSEPTTSTQEYALSFPNGDHTIHVDPYLVDNCTGTSIDEASTESEENCRFAVLGGKVMIIATRTIEPGEQLLTRYGYEYWMNPKWPLALLETMFNKYRKAKPAGLRTDQWQRVGAEWKRMIIHKREEEQTRRLWRPRSILRTPNPHLPSPCPTTKKTRNPSVQQVPAALTKSRQQLLFMPRPTANTMVSLTPAQRRARRKRKLAHQRAVRRGKTSPLRVRPAPPPTAPLEDNPDLFLRDWRKVVTPRHPTHSSLCSMSWSCRGSLFDDGAYLSKTVPDCFEFAAHLMQTYAVDILWLNDARFTAGTLNRHLHLLRTLMPDCRLLQFPTTHVKTGSGCQQNNQMGGAVAIVNYKWKNFIVENSMSTDPMGMGIINSIDIRLDDYWIRAVNIYFLCTSLTTGYATMHSRIKRHQQTSNIPAWQKRLTTQDLHRYSTRRLLDTGR